MRAHTMQALDRTLVCSWADSSGLSRNVGLKMAAENMRLWAIKGAEQRLVELAEEAKAIFATFPELRAQGRGFMAPATAEPSNVRMQAIQNKPSRRRKRTMSAEARKRIGDAQRERWAKRREGKTNEPANPPPPQKRAPRRALKKR